MNEELVEVTNLSEAEKLIDGWIRAYRRLEIEHEALKHKALHLESAIRFDAIAQPLLQPKFKDAA